MKIKFLKTGVYLKGEIKFNGETKKINNFFNNEEEMWAFLKLQ